MNDKFSEGIEGLHGPALRVLLLNLLGIDIFLQLNHVAVTTHYIYWVLLLLLGDYPGLCSMLHCYNHTV